jgi:putative FmdB family regulatory protein
MPLYEYQCDACAHRFEVIQQYKDAPIAVCPKCAGTVKKLFSSPAIQFKGSGFYITDYARKGSESATTKSGETKSDSTASSSESKSDSKSEAKSDSKTETKSESKPATSGS